MCDGKNDAAFICSYASKPLQMVNTRSMKAKNKVTDNTPTTSNIILVKAPFRLIVDNMEEEFYNKFETRFFQNLNGDDVIEYTAQALTEWLEFWHNERPAQVTNTDENIKEYICLNKINRLLDLARNTHQFDNIQDSLKLVTTHRLRNDEALQLDA
jgi:hypothetical protein